MADFPKHPMPFFVLREKSNAELDRLFKELNEYCSSDPSRYTVDLYLDMQTTMNRINRIFCERGFSVPGYENGSYDDSPTKTTSPPSAAKPAPPQNPSQDKPAPGPSHASTSLPDTHRLTRTSHVHIWPASFILTWSTAELHRVLKAITAEAEDPDGHNDALFSQWNIERELALRTQDPSREARLVTELSHAAPPPPQQNVHVHATTQNVHVHAPRPVVHVHEQSHRVHVHEQLPPRVFYHRAETRRFRHPAASAQSYVRRYEAGREVEAGREYERAGPQGGHVEFRPRGNKEKKDKKKEEGKGGEK